MKSDKIKNDFIFNKKRTTKICQAIVSGKDQ